jgi:hypothetical protein
LPHTGGHAPQSAGQEEHVSPDSHAPLPHTGGQGPQSAGQEEHVSPDSHAPLPHTGPPPQVRPQMLDTLETQAVPQLEEQHVGNCAQIWPTQPSHVAASGAPAAHLSWAHGHAPQSAGQLVHVSPVSQVPLPHTAVEPLLDEADVLLEVEDALVEEEVEELLALVEDEALVEEEEELEISPLDELLEISPLDELVDDGPAPCPLADDELLASGPPPLPEPPSPRLPPWAQPATAANAAATLNKAR